jgi:hypothetical protein
MESRASGDETSETQLLEFLRNFYNWQCGPLYLHALYFDLMTLAAEYFIWRYVRCEEERECDVTCCAAAGASGPFAEEGHRRALLENQGRA